MKKIFIFLSILVITYFILNGKSDNVIIPTESIRFRVIANSNSIEDQAIKTKVRDKVELVLYDLLKDVEQIEEVRDIIVNNLDLINETVDQELINETYDYDVNFGYNYFPKKEYDGLIYKEGEYESLLITLGNGEGDNWWCVLFPPFCLLEAEEGENVEYKFLLKELIDKYFN